jgi:hypothetical protein
MVRHILQLTVLCALVACWPVSFGQAFTLQLGPMPPAESPMPSVTAADLPTPQLFRVALDSRGLTLGVVPPAVGFQTPKIDIHRQDVPVPQPSSLPVVQESQRRDSPRLRGAEVMLLRQTEMVASEQSK